MKSLPPPPTGPITSTSSIVLSGMPGAGKSSVGPRLAAALDVPFVDTDDMVRTKSGKTPGEFLRERGEAAFRALEAEVVDELFRDRQRRVVSLGGGTVVDRRLRHSLLDRALLVTLSAREDTLRARITTGSVPDRPLAGADGAALGRLLEARRSAYAECHVAVATDDLSLDDVVDAIVPWRERRLVVVPLGERTYTVELVVGEPTRVVDRLAALAPSSIVSVTDGHLQRAQKQLFAAMLEPLNVPHVPVVLAPGEVHKTLASVSTIWDAALGARVDRDSVVFGFGGGVVLDLAGFAASTLLRGVRWLGAPTTVLAMVDASVGGKTGFDHPTGKNLVGSFHQPSGVVAELSSLTTLSDRERRAGLAEALKIALTSDSALFERIEACAEQLAAGRAEALLPVIEGAVAAKARIVRDDEHEQGDRALLNFAHTVGHGLEAHGGYTKWLHGEAVAMGLVAELKMGEVLGFTPRALIARVETVLVRLGLPGAPAESDLAAAASWVGTDKKRSGRSLRLPVVHEIGRSTVEKVPMERVSTLMGKVPNSAR